MKHLLLNWSWLVCLLVAGQGPIHFLTKYAQSWDFGLWGEPRLSARRIKDLAGVCYTALLAVLAGLWIFASWKVTSFVLGACIVAGGLDEIVSLPCWLLADRRDTSTDALVIGPAFWLLCSLALLLVKIRHSP